MSDIPYEFASRWRLVFQILSLDYILPLWVYMGLGFPEATKELLKTNMRDSYIEWQKINSTEYRIEVKKLVDNTLSKIQFILGKGVTEQVRFWCDSYITIYGVDKKISTTIENWRRGIVGFYNRSLAVVKEPNVLNWDEARYKELVYLIEKELVVTDEKWEKLVEEYKDRVEMDSTQYSQWDKVIFSREYEESVTGIDALFTIIESVGEDYNLFRFWSCFKKQFNETEVESVEKWIEQERGEQPISLKEKFDEFALINQLQDK